MGDSDGLWHDLLFGFGTFGTVLTVFGGLILLLFIVMLARALVGAVRYATSKDQQAPARLVTKRLQVNGGSGSVGDVPATGSSTRYYATFEFADGTRREFRVRDRDYGMLVEGDEGTLTYRNDVFQRLDRTPRGVTPSASAQPLAQPVQQPLPQPGEGTGRRIGQAWDH